MSVFSAVHALMATATLSLAGHVSAPPALASGSCPAEHPSTRQMAVSFLTLDAHAPSRTETGTLGIDPAALRLLNDTQDAAVCQRLNSDLGAAGQYGSWQWSYYTAGGFYFVSIRSTKAQRLGPLPLLVYDASLNRIGGYAM